MRAREGLDEALALGVDHPELVEVDVGAVLVEHAQDGRLAADEGQRGDADVDPAAVDVQGDASVLGHAALGDVQVGHDLDARDHAGHEAPRDARVLAQDAVDAVAHGEVAGDGLEVDVGGALLDALADQRVHELDDRRVGGRLAQVDDLRPVVGVDRLGDHDLVEGVQALDERGDVLLGRDGGPHLVAAHQRDVVDGEDVAGVDHRDEQRAVVDDLDRDRAVALGRARGQQVGGRHVDLEDAEVDLVDAEALGDHARELVGRQDAALDEHLARAPSVGPRLRDRCLDRLPAGVSEVHHDVADEARRAPAAGGLGQAGKTVVGRRGGLGKRHTSCIGRVRPFFNAYRAASRAWLTSASASAFWARGTERTLQRLKARSASIAWRCSGRMSGCLTL